MTSLNLIGYELKWRLREPLTISYILSPICIGALIIFDLVPENLVNYYGYFYKPPEALFSVIMQMAVIVWLVLSVSVMAKNYTDKKIFLSLPANRLQLWTAKTISLFFISVLYYVTLALVIYIANIVTAGGIAISPLCILLTSLSSGGSLMIFLALSSHVRNRLIFIGLSFLVIIAPTVIKPIYEYFIGNFLVLRFYNSDNIPEQVVCFFKYYLPFYYVLSFFIGYLGYRNMKTSHEI